MYPPSHQHAPRRSSVFCGQRAGRRWKFVGKYWSSVARRSLWCVCKWHRKFHSVVAKNPGHSWKAPLLEYYIPDGPSLSSAICCCPIGKHLKPVIRSRQHGLLRPGALLQHVNACSHTARMTVDKITGLRFECLIHPPFLVDLAQCTVCSVGSLKGFLGGRMFSTDGDLKVAAYSWLWSRPTTFFIWMCTLVKHWR